MKKIGEKVSYIKGLAEGIEIDQNNKEGRILIAVLDVLSDIADALTQFDEELDEAADVLAGLEQDVNDVKDEIYGQDDDEDYFEGDLDDLYETTCPSCGNTIRFDYDQAASGGMECPNCGQHLAFQIDDDE